MGGHSNKKHYSMQQNMPAKSKLSPHVGTPENADMPGKGPSRYLRRWYAQADHLPADAFLSRTYKAPPGGNRDSFPCFLTLAEKRTQRKRKAEARGSDNASPCAYTCKKEVQQQPDSR